MEINLHSKKSIICAKCGRPIGDKWATLTWQASQKDSSKRKEKEICLHCYDAFKDWFYNIQKEDNNDVEVYYVR